MTDEPVAPVAAPPFPTRKPHKLESGGHVRTDDWWWLRDKDDPAVIEHLKAENAYGESVLSSSKTLQEQLFQEIKNRIKEDDVSAPARSHGWWYWSATSEGQQYARFYRRANGPGTSSAIEVLEHARA